MYSFLKIAHNPSPCFVTDFVPSILSCFAFNAMFSAALREDRYFVAGRAIAVSLVHGGPPLGFLAPTLYSCLVGGKSSVKPVLEDIADTDLYEKVKKVNAL